MNSGFALGNDFDSLSVWTSILIGALEADAAAPSLVPKRAGDRVKTNRRDAISVALLHRAGDRPSARRDWRMPQKILASEFGWKGGDECVSISP